LRATAAVLLALASCLALTGSGSPIDTKPHRHAIYDPARDPSRDLEEALREAARDEKRVLLDVGGDWCGWCRELDHFLRTDAAVADAFRCAFVVVKVNVSPANPNSAFLSRFPEIPGYPYLFVLDASGRLLAALDTDDLLRGESYDRRRALTFAKKWTVSPHR